MDLTGDGQVATHSAGIQSAGISTTVGQAYLVTFEAYNWSLTYPGPYYGGPAISLQASGGFRTGL